ncbi:MAG: AtpZ/AtpI family protein [Lachnospiraceae bacterium]|nr:AtpZ/AtpI family protein [Lachnospiraceae bacterium]
MKDLGKVMTDIVYVGQLGLDMVVPVILCLGVSYYLHNNLHLGVWVFVPGLALGLGGSAMSFKRFYHRIVMKGTKKKDKKELGVPVFSRHE